MRSVWRTAVVAAAAAGVLAGCGDEPGNPADPGKVRSVVERFAAARDASACDLLTGDALVNVYGGFTAPVEKAKANCVRKSRRFQGEQVKIQKVSVVDEQTAKVSALGADGKFTYSITVRKPHKRWLIDEINQYKVR